MALDVLGMMDAETKRASERAASGSFVPTFLRLNDGQKARIRPLFNLDQCVVLAMHSKFNQVDPKQSINAVCAMEAGGSDCPYCAAVKDDKKLAATTVFMLPVYVSSIEQKNDAGNWIPVMYKDKEDHEVAVSGLRILELKAFGTIASVLQSLRSLYSEDDKHDVRRYGLIVERVGSGQQTKYTILPKGPAEMPANAKAAIPTQDMVRQMVLAACPPPGVTVSASTATATSPTKVSEVDNDF